MARVLTEECGALAVMYHWDEFEEKMAEVVRAVNAAVDTSAVDDGPLGDADKEETAHAALDGGKVLTGQRGARDSAMSATA